jgi:hypothetical protein
MKRGVAHAEKPKSNPVQLQRFVPSNRKNNQRLSEISWGYSRFLPEEN